MFPVVPFILNVQIILKATRDKCIVSQTKGILMDLPGRASFSVKNGLSEGILYGAPSSLFSMSTRSTLPRSVDLSDPGRRRVREDKVF